MSPRRRTAAILALIAAWGAAALAQETVTPQVTYVSGSSVYLNVGADDGLAEGARVEITRGDQAIAAIEITHLSPHRASGKIVEQSSEVQPGDGARFEPRAAPRPEVPAPAPGVAASVPARRSPPGPGWAGFHGRIGVQYLAVQEKETDSGFSQPGLNFRLLGSRIGGTGWGVGLDVRATRTYRDLAGVRLEDVKTSRVYRASFGWEGTSAPVRFTLGRQYVSALSTVSIFDGLSLEYAKPRWGFGVIGGSQPDPIDLDYSTEIREYGIYYQVHGGATTTRRWDLTTGVIGAYHGSEVDREFFYVQGRYGGPRLSLFLTEEIDFNRSWKAETGEGTVSPTATFLSAYYRLGNRVSLRGGYDNRRNPRLFRDRTTPETEFDDAYRQGIWAGAGFRFGRHVDLGVDARSNSGGVAGDSLAYTATLGIIQLGPTAVGIRLRGTAYDNDRVRGTLASLSVDVPIGRRVSVGLTGGLREETSQVAASLDSSFVWYGLDLDIGLARHWFLVVSAERSRGDFELVDQGYLSISYQF